MINPKEFLKNFVCDKNIITLYNFHLRYYSGLVAQNTVRVYTFSPVSKPTIWSRHGDQKKIPERAQSAAVDWARRTAACCTDEASHLQAFTGIQFTTQTHTNTHTVRRTLGTRRRAYSSKPLGHKRRANSPYFLLYSPRFRLSTL